MKNSTNNNQQQVGFLVLGALFGIAAALISSKPLLNLIQGCKRDSDVKDYLGQSGEGSGKSAKAIQKHDEKMFEEEIAAEA
ncbi:MAG: hypothetical protein ABI811_08560 [Acidobacteriota bacterium]